MSENVVKKFFKNLVVLVGWNFLAYIAMSTLVGKAQAWTSIYGKL